MITKHQKLDENRIVNVPVINSLKLQVTSPITDTEKKSIRISVFLKGKNLSIFSE